MTKNSGVSIFLIIAIAIGFIFLIPNLRSFQQGAGVHGKITTVNLDIYKDSFALQQLTEIDWGIIDPGGTSTTTIYVKSTSNVPVTLSHQESNWQPMNAPAYITLSWDYTGVIMQPDSMQTIKLTLHVSPTITGISDFAFDLTIIGSGGA